MTTAASLLSFCQLLHNPRGAEIALQVPIPSPEICTSSLCPRTTMIWVKADDDGQLIEAPGKLPLARLWVLTDVSCPLRVFSSLAGTGAAISPRNSNADRFADGQFREWTVAEFKPQSRRTKRGDRWARSPESETAIGLFAGQ
jgi:hypothetical protein